MKDELDIPIWDCLETVDDISNFQVRLYNWGKRQATFVALREAPAASPGAPQRNFIPITRLLSPAPGGGELR